MKIKVEHQKQKRLAAKQTHQMEEIKKQLEQVQEENQRLAQSVSKLESSYIGVSSTRSSLCKSTPVVQAKVMTLSINVDDNSSDYKTPPQLQI